MTDPVDTPAINSGKPDVQPLKAERIQWVLLALDLGNRSYDFANETEGERDARLEAGWRKRTTGGLSQLGAERDAA